MTNKDYVLMAPTSTYALGVEAIRESYNNCECPSQPIFTKPDGSCIVRSLTFRENLQARIEDYNTLNNADGSIKTDDERLRFFNKWLDSCTGIAYKKGTTKFKIVPQSQDLIEIPSEFKEAFLEINYDSIDGIELDSSKNKYNDLLTLSKVKSHPAWITTVEEDTVLLSEYANIVFGLLKEKYKRTNGMGFFVRSNTKTDELRALFVSNIDDYSYAVGNYSLNNGGSFLLVAPSQNFSTRNNGEKK